MTAEDGLSRRQRRALKRAREQRAADLQWLMRDARGRRIVAKLLDDTHVGRNAFTGNSQGFFQQGKQAIGNGLVAEIKACALLEFHAMELEQRAAAEREREEAEQASAADELE